MKHDCAHDHPLHRVGLRLVTRRPVERQGQGCLCSGACAASSIACCARDLAGIIDPGGMNEGSLEMRRPMPKMRLGVEQIVTSLRQVGFLRGQSKSVAATCKEAGLGEAKMIMVQGRFHNTTRRRHSALGYCPPAPVTIAARPHSNKPSTFNSFSRRLVEYVGQATGIMPQHSGLVYPFQGSRLAGVRCN